MNITTVSARGNIFGDKDHVEIRFENPQMLRSVMWENGDFSAEGTATIGRDNALWLAAQILEACGLRDDARTYRDMVHPAAQA